jgi:hypothetical protein
MPIFKENCPDIPDMRVLHFKVLLRPQAVAAILRISQHRVYQLCDDGILQQVKVGSFIIHHSKGASSSEYPAAAFSIFSRKSLEASPDTV